MRLRSRRGKLLSNALLQLLLCILFSSSFTSARASTLLPRPISALLLLLLLLELGGVLVSLFNCAELVSSLLVISGDGDDSLSSAGFPSRVKSAYDVFYVTQLGFSTFRS